MSEIDSEDKLRQVAARLLAERDSFKRAMDRSLAELQSIKVKGSSRPSRLDEPAQIATLRASFPARYAGAIAVSGRVGAGKHDVAEGLAALLGWKHASFGRYVRREAIARDRPLQRHDLQTLGDELIEELGWELFVRNTVTSAGVEIGKEPFVVDGVRHVDALSALQKLLDPWRVVLLFLDVDDTRRRTRLVAEGVAPEAVPIIERHDTEEDVSDGDLLKAADHVLTSDGQTALSQAVSGLTRIAPVLTRRAP
jgi:hypothetical protein